MINVREYNHVKVNTITKTLYNEIELLCTVSKLCVKFKIVETHLQRSLDTSNTTRSSISKKAAQIYMIHDKLVEMISDISKNFTKLNFHFFLTYQIVVKNI